MERSVAYMQWHMREHFQGMPLTAPSEASERIIHYKPCWLDNEF